MVWDKCSVVLNMGISGAFYTGDIVTGSINFEFKTGRKIDYIKCAVIGTSEAQWTRSIPTIPYIKNHSEKIKVLDIDVDLFENQTGTTVGPGMETYNFHFALPEDLPSTFQTSVAKVKYYVKIEGKVAYKLKKREYVPFIVLGRVNLNTLESFMTPFYTEFSKTLWKSSRIILCLKTFRGFAPKQNLPFEIIIANENKTKISKIKICLVQKLEYTVSSGYAKEEIFICKSEYKKFSNDNHEACNFYMTIPETVPSSIHQTNPMIEITYILRVEVMFPFHFSLYEEIPVTVASDPVNHYDTEQIKNIQGPYILFYSVVDI